MTANKGNKASNGANGPAVEKSGVDAHDRKADGMGASYEVKDGDSLESVAEEVGMEPDELKGLNPEIGQDNFLYAGQTLRLK